MSLLISNNIYLNLAFFVIGTIFFTWISTQGFKVLLKLYLGEKFKFSMIFADGDFPSTHTAVKNLKDLIANTSNIDNNSIQILEKKNIITDVITQTFESIDNEALKRVGHLKHELVGGILSGFLGASYSTCIFFGYFKYIPLLIVISLLYFFGMGTFLKLKLIFDKLSKNFKY